MPQTGSSDLSATDSQIQNLPTHFFMIDLDVWWEFGDHALFTCWTRVSW